MASLALILWSKKRTDGTHTIAFRLTINRVAKFEMTPYHVLPANFHPGLSDWVYNHPDAKRINRNLEMRRQEIANNLLDADAGMRPMTHAAILAKEGEASKGATLGAVLIKKAEYFEKRKSRRWHLRCLSLREEVLTAWGNDLPLARLTVEHVEHLRLHFADILGNNANTIAGKMSILRRLIRAEIDAGRYIGGNAFTQVKFKRDPVRKTKLTWAEMTELEACRFTGLRQVVLDMFLFSFYCQGMRFENCLLFKKADAKEMQYRMNKGRKVRDVHMHPKLKKIITRYDDGGPLCNPGPYLFPFVKKEPTDHWAWEEEKDRHNSVVNNYLKGTVARVGIDKDISFHVARHTFADLMKKHQAGKGQSNIYIIQQALGHSDIKTTQMYLDSLGDDVVNNEVAEMFAGRDGERKDCQ